jgi:hypothetical protein
MADLDVVHKDRSGLSWVLWVVIAIIVALLLWWAFSGRPASPGAVGAVAPAQAPAIAQTAPGLQAAA